MPDIGSFAHGLVTGYGQGRQMRERRERHELEIAAKRDEQEMREAFKKINTDAKVDEQFAVRNADGDQVIYADRKEAEKAAGAPELVEPIYAVGGANYVSRDEADAASMILNSPMHRLKMQAEVANAYGRPDIAASLAKSHTALLDATRKSMQDAFITARQSGDIQTVLNARNELLASAGAQAQLFDDGTGGMILRTVDRNGDVVGEQHYATPEQMWDMMGQEMMETPDNALALWKARNDKAHQDRSFGLKEKATLHGMQMAEGQLANSRASVGIAGGQLALAREKFAADQNKPFALSTQVGKG